MLCSPQVIQFVMSQRGLKHVCDCESSTFPLLSALSAILTNFLVNTMHIFPLKESNVDT